MEPADLPSTGVRIVDLQSVDTGQMAVADISMSNRRHNCSNGRLTAVAQDILGLLAKGKVAGSAEIEIEWRGYSPAELETVEEAARRKRAEVAGGYDAESEALPEERTSGLLVCEVVVQDAQLSPLVAMQAGHLL